MVMMNPSTNPSTIITHSFLDLVILLPTFSPMGVIAISAPRVKNIMPITSITAPRIYSSIMLGEIGAMEKHSKSTITIIGKTALTASFSFSFNLNPSSVLRIFTSSCTFPLLKNRLLSVVIFFMLLKIICHFFQIWITLLIIMHN